MLWMNAAEHTCNISEVAAGDVKKQLNTVQMRAATKARGSKDLSVSLIRTWIPGSSPSQRINICGGDHGIFFFMPVTRESTHDLIILSPRSHIPRYRKGI